VTAASLHNQFIGNFQGLNELERLLDAREAELKSLIQLQQRQDEERQQNA